MQRLWNAGIHVELTDIKVKRKKNFEYLSIHVRCSRLQKLTISDDKICFSYFSSKHIATVVQQVSKIKERKITKCKPKFYCIKVVFEGVEITFKHVVGMMNT